MRCGKADAMTFSLLRLFLIRFSQVLAVDAALSGKLVQPLSVASLERGDQFPARFLPLRGIPFHELMQPHMADQPMQLIPQRSPVHKCPFCFMAEPEQRNPGNLRYFATVPPPAKRIYCRSSSFPAPDACLPLVLKPALCVRCLARERFDEENLVDRIQPRLAVFLRRAAARRNGKIRARRSNPSFPGESSGTEAWRRRWPGLTSTSPTGWMFPTGLKRRETDPIP